MIVYAVVIYDTVDHTDDLLEIYSNEDAAKSHKEFILLPQDKHRFAVVRYIEVKDKFP